ncbi:PaaX family transcriptional regulator [Prescottella agglutinans]|uniref:Phenylacetic acid degradation operon negative regulatory protein n=1 Tax=Prescottella agglutinans TaxID=1644129 RepID=A0ABT6MMD3_9NOCA|nr:PaaX family transcriptional regulator C-terminal domain-containing protein [Prescottella agglutinans]MDH6284694.1 phenylacetic acid degradation operon negative regulatory protein [Prescottella agglutinans]
MIDPDIASTSDKDTTASRSARSVLVTVLGELVEPYGQPIRTAALLYVLQGLGFGEHAARQALARTRSSGLIAAERVGRETLWHLTDKAHSLFTKGDVRVFSTDVDVTQWDGRWLVINVPVPESHRSSRKKLYAALRWAGFGNPAPGVWVTPHVDRAEEVATTIEALGLADNTITFIGPLGQPGMTESELVQRSWNLDEAEEAYDALLERFAVQEFAPGDELLFAHLELADSLRRMPYMDPRLPEVLLPNWAGLRSAKRLRDLRAEWTPMAHARWRQIAGLI